FGEAMALNDLGVVYGQMRRLGEAIACLRQSVATWRELGDRHSEGRALNDLGNALRAKGNAAQARTCWREALAILENFQDPEAQRETDRARSLLAEPDRRS
ncbi:MAG: tetratricopeptide repeat protein, partial [Stackebrandtia sp.]